MKIAHLYWHNNGNWGDVAVGNVTRKLFSEFCGDHVYNTFKISDSLDYNEINKNDLLLIGGGGIFLWLGYFLSRTNQLKDIKIPIIIYSIGLNSFKVKGNTSNGIQYPNEWLELLKEKCLFISARNDGTRKEIFDFNGVDFLESPEPCIYTNRFYNQERLINDKYIVISLASDLNKNRFVRNGVDFRDFYNRINSLTKHIKSMGYKVQAINHRIEDEGFGIDKEIEWNLEEELSRENVLKGFSLYQHADVVITMRGHGQIIPFSYSTPVITIANQNKSYGFAKSAGIDDYLINVAEKEMVDKVLGVIEDIETNRNKIQYNISGKKSEFWQNTTSDFKIIKEKLGII